MTAGKKHYGKIEDQKFLPKNIIEEWNPFVPRIWSEKSIYAQTVTEVLKAFKVKDSFNYLVFYGTMLAYEPYLIKFLIPSIKLYCGSNILSYLKILIVYFKKSLGISVRRLKFKAKNSDYDLVIADSVHNVMQTLKASKINLNLLDPNL